MFNYEPGNRIAAADGEIEEMASRAELDDALEFSREVFVSQRDYLNQLHSDWYNQIIFAHGQQDSAIDMVTGSPTRLPSKAYRTYDFTLPILQRVISKLSSVSTKREAHPTTTDTTDIGASRTATDYISSIYEELDFDNLNNERIDWKVKIGNSVVYLPWMKGEGDIDPATGFPSGKQDIIIDPGFHWIWDPRVTQSKRVEYAIRQTLQTQEWVERNFPEQAANVPKQYYNEAFSTDFFQLALMGMNGTRSSYGLNQLQMPKNKGLVRVFETFVKSCPRYPYGQISVSVGDSSGPGKTLRATINPYVEPGRKWSGVPAVHFGLIRVTGRIWHDSLTQYLMDPQTELNHRVRQISRNAARISNPQLAIPNNGPATESITDKIGGAVRYPIDSDKPDYIVPPALSQQVYESLDFAVNAMNRIAEPFGLDSLERASKATSGIQLSLLDERESELIAPMVKEDQIGINTMWTQVLDNMRMFGGPQTIKYLSADNKWKARSIKGSMLTPNMRIMLTEKNELPRSRTATWAEIQELGKSGLIDMSDPMVKQRALVAIGRGDLSVEFRDGAADFKKAQRNITKAIYTTEVPEPAPFDDLSIHITSYTGYLKTADFEELQVENPEAATRVAMMIDAFNEARAALMQMQAEQAAAAAAAMGPNGEPGNPGQPGNPNAAQMNAGVTAPQGPKATQGFEPLNPAADNGGDPMRGR